MNVRICGLPEQLETGIEVRRYPLATWWLAGNLTALSHDVVRDSIQKAFDAWSQVAGCSGSEAEAENSADLIITVIRMDGPQGVLADCELPGTRPQHMRLDNSESWVVFLGSDVPQEKIDLVRVLTHELGHFWGMGHISRGNLMAPVYSQYIDKPVQGDIQEMQSRYGPPRAKPSDSPAGGVDLPSEMWIVGESKKITAKFKLTRLD